MESSSHISPLLDHAIRIRAKNVELRQTIAQLQADIHNLEKDISTITVTHDDLAEQCRILREQQTEELSSKQSEKDFHQYIQDITDYIDTKSWKPISNEKPSSSGKVSPSFEKIEELPIQTLHDDLNQQLASVENWLMESAITSHEKSSPILIENSTKDDDSDDLYKDLMLPTLAEDIQFDENHHQQHESFGKNLSPDHSKQQQQRLDKSQRRFVLMRQLAEKSNKTVTKKLI